RIQFAAESGDLLLEVGGGCASVSRFSSFGRPTGRCTTPSHFAPLRGSWWSDFMEVPAAAPCPLWVKSRHMQRKTACPLYPKATSNAIYEISAKGQKQHSDDVAAEGGSSLLQSKPSSKCDENCTGGCLDYASDMGSIEPTSEETEKQNHY